MHIENRAIGAGVCECRLRVKGKQVEDLRDLVTVSGEHWIMRMPEGHGSHWFLETGKAILCVGSCEPGNLPVVGTGAFQTTRTWSCRMIFIKIFSGFSCPLFVVCPGIPKSIVSVRVALYHTILEEDVS